MVIMNKSSNISRQNETHEVNLCHTAIGDGRYYERNNYLSYENTNAQTKLINMATL